MKTLRIFLQFLFVVANVVAVVLLIVSAYSDRVSPETSMTLSYLGLAFPVLCVVNLCFIIYWLFLWEWKFLLIGIFSFLLCWGPVKRYFPFHSHKDVPREEVLKVLTYNVMAFGYKNHTKIAPNKIIQYIANSDADIVCLQEAQPTGRNAEQIDSMLKPIYAYQDVTVHPHGGNALMLLSKYPILSKELIPYESQGNMSVAYRLKINDKPVLLINNHLETTGLSKEDRQQFKKLVVGKLQVDTAEQTSKLLVVKLAEATKKRAPQAEAVARYIREHRGMSTILCGDFNDGPISYVHRTIAKNLVECYVESGNGPGISYHRGGFFVRIDNIMCSEDWEPYECKVDDKIAVSDHYPIICKLKKRPKKQK